MFYAYFSIVELCVFVVVAFSRTMDTGHTSYFSVFVVTTVFH